MLRINGTHQPTSAHPPNNLVATTSGGQRRRVSLAAALVHSPPLLILDEPTVGVDPLLRQSIWQHLVTLTKTERISVIITTHYIEEARQANMVGLMRYGKILAENSPDQLMRTYALDSLEQVFLTLCVTDSARRAASMAGGSSVATTSGTQVKFVQDFSQPHQSKQQTADSNLFPPNDAYSHRWDSLKNKRYNRDNQSQLSTTKASDRKLTKKTDNLSRPSIDVNSETSSDENLAHSNENDKKLAHIKIHTATNRVVQVNSIGFANETIEFSSISSSSDESSSSTHDGRSNFMPSNPSGAPKLPDIETAGNKIEPFATGPSKSEQNNLNDYLAIQTIKWAARRSNELNMISFYLNNRAFVDGDQQLRPTTSSSASKPSKIEAARSSKITPKASRALEHSDLDSYNLFNKRLNSRASSSSCYQWWQTLAAVTWKNYIRLRRNPPVLVFQFMLPAVQVILFCLCIGGEPFDVPVAVVNEESTPRSSLQFLNGLNKKVIRQIKYDNLTSAIDAVRRGKVWGAIHIPDKYSQHLQSRLIMGEDVTSDTINNGTIKVYPDLTSKYTHP